MEEVNLFPTTIHVFHHNDNAIDSEVEGIPDDPDILSHISRNARADIKTGSHNGMKNLKMFEKYELPHLEDFFNECLWEVDARLSIEQSWINKGPKDSHQIAHTHSGFKVSGVYWHNITAQQGGIVFMNPIPFAKMGHWGTEEGRHFPCTSRTLILFPSWLEHKTVKNGIDRDRISIAFNAR